jgi:SAM-dependent methyltransferase
MRPENPAAREAGGLLGDTPARDYARKLSLFARFAAPELRQAVAGLGLTHGMQVLDAGCGTGEALQWFRDAVGAEGQVAGIDLSAAHIAAARAQAPCDVLTAQADLMRPPLRPGSFDVIWSVNTINHLRDPRAGLAVLGTLLRAGGRLALGQGGFLPEMYFAWDARLERRTTEAVRRYYRDKYSLDERDLAASRSLVGLLRRAGLRDVRARTFPIERISPLNADDERYLLEAIFQDTWGARLRPYLSAADHAELTRLCDPSDPGFALRRPDFHLLQTFTLVTGRVAAGTH